jgi:hypothetical protein
MYRKSVALLARGVLVWAGLAGLGPLGFSATTGSPSFPPLPASAPLVFQQTLTGLLPAQARELRWTLRFSAGQPRLSVQERACPGPSLKGGAAPVCKAAFGAAKASYQGKLSQRPYGVELWLSTTDSVEGFPSELTLTCLRTVVAVLPAGASLLSGDACKGDGPPPRWQPGKGQDVGLWHCQSHDENGRPWSGYGSLGPLSFGDGAGVEWVFVNNDCAGQEGAYRLLSPRP